MALTAEVHRDSKQRREPYSPFDFLPEDFPMQPTRTRKPQAELHAKIDALFGVDGLFASAVKRED